MGDLLGFISTITKAYKAQGLKDNKFGLAAFGGDGVHKEPHFHTIEGELMNSDRKFVRGVRSLDFAEGTPMNFVEGAIAFAAKNYPWRTGAKRNIIVVSCSQCMDRIPPHTDLPAILMATKGKSTCSVTWNSPSVEANAPPLSWVSTEPESTPPKTLPPRRSPVMPRCWPNSPFPRKPASQPSWRLKALSSLFTN